MSRILAIIGVLCVVAPAAANICVTDSDWLPTAKVSNNDQLFCGPTFTYLLSKFDQNKHNITARDGGDGKGNIPGWNKLTCEDINNQDYKDVGDDRTHNVGRTLRHYGPSCCGNGEIMCAGAAAIAPAYVLVFAASAVSLLSAGL